MATETYIPLAEVTLVATANYCDFTSISQDYSDLVLVFECEGSASNRINGYLNKVPLITEWCLSSKMVGLRVTNTLPTLISTLGFAGAVASQ
tara:strand:+ start:463 stop:738 length:276 start_codon:yes stop_codon:yes gene_type:complete